MTALSIQPTFPIFTDIDGQPLEDGYVFIGTANLNPITNPITVYWDAALTLTAVQPIRTLGGYPMNSGTPARLYVNSDYSIQVQNRNGSMVYSAPAATERYGNVISFADITGTLGSDRVSFLQAGSGAITRSAQAKMRDIVNVNDFGADPTGVNDSSAAFAAAIAAVDKGGTIYLNGVYKTTEEILITKTLSIVGQDARVGNVVNPAQSRSCIIADSGTDGAAILVNDCAATFKNFVLVNGPTTPSVRVDGIRCQGENGCLKIYDLLVEGFLTGIRSTTNYYNTIENTSIAFCDECLRFDNCYNVNLVGMKLRTNNTPVFASATYGLMLLNASQANMFGGAIENFDNAAVYMPGSNNSVALFGVYFESHSTTNSSEVVEADSYSKVVAIGCHVYMTHSERFISVMGAGSVGVQVYSKSNRIVYPTTTKTVDVYVPLANDTTANWDVSGDNWQSPIGANVKYVSQEAIGGQGSVRIAYPVGHPTFSKPIDTTLNSPAPWVTQPTLPTSVTTGTALPTFVSYANQSGTSADDPLNLRTTSWGYFPYMTIYQKGQWEKVGMRLPNQVNSTATTVADIVTDFNSLLAKLRANGVMV
jgi:hypothetical protein